MRMGVGVEGTRVTRKRVSMENKIKLICLGKPGCLMKNRWMSYQPRKKHTRSCTRSVFPNWKDKLTRFRTLIRDPSNRVAFTRPFTLRGDCNSKDNRTLTPPSTLKFSTDIQAEVKKWSPFRRHPLCPFLKTDAKYRQDLAQAALKYHNKRKGTCFELVETLRCNKFFYCGYYNHINFTAKLPDCNFSECFFAEVQCELKKVVTVCVILEGDPNSERMYCGACKEEYVHHVRHPMYGYRFGVVD